MKSEYNHYPDKNILIKRVRYERNFAKSHLVDAVLADSRKKKEFSKNDIFATSGQLVCKADVDGTLKAFTSTYNFRMLMNLHDAKNSKIAFSDSKFSVEARIAKSHTIESNSGSGSGGSGVPLWSGFHLFGRYQTENNLYVVSFRLDGTIVIKKKKQGTYTTLASCISKIDTLSQHKFSFELKSEKLIFYIDDCVVLTATDSDRELTWGTHGIRTDYCDVFINSITLE